MGIIGLGRIKSTTAKRAQGLSRQVLTYDPYIRPGTDKVIGGTLVELDELLIMSAHTPLTEETRNLIDTEAIGKIKPTAILVNTDAVADALVSNQIAGARIDILTIRPASASMKLIQLRQEDRAPPVKPYDHPAHCLLFPRRPAGDEIKSAQEAAHLISGKPPLNCVNSQYFVSR